MIHETGSLFSAPMSAGRKLAFWIASFLIVGMVLFIYKGVPLYPILAGGGLALAGTFLGLIFKRNGNQR